MDFSAPAPSSRRGHRAGQRHARCAAKTSAHWATNTNGWEGSDPKALYVWCQNEVGNPERAQLRRTVRYLKAWAAICFGADQSGRPTSVLLTVIANEAFLELDDHVPPARYRERLLAAETPV